MARVDPSKRFALTEQETASERPQIWVEGRQQPRFKLGPYVAVSLAMAKRDLRPGLIEGEARLRRYGRQLRAGEARLGWLGRFAPEEDRLAAWAETMASVVEGARLRLGQGEAGEAVVDGLAYVEVLRRNPAAHPVRPRRAAKAAASVQKPMAEDKGPPAPADTIGGEAADPGPRLLKAAEGIGRDEAALCPPVKVLEAAQAETLPAALDPELAAIRRTLEHALSDDIADGPEAPPSRFAAVAPDRALPSWPKDWQPPSAPEGVLKARGGLLQNDKRTPVARTGLWPRIAARFGPLARRSGQALAHTVRVALRRLALALRPIAARAVTNLAGLAHVAASWALLVLLMMIAVPRGAYGALVYHLDGGELEDWS